MKTLHLKLKKNVLIVDVPELTDYEVFKHGIYFNFENGDRDFIEGNFTFLCKGEELTEEQCKELVDLKKEVLGSKSYVDYKNKSIYTKSTAKASFLSAISAQNYHWLENPRGETKPISFEEDDMMGQLWEIAESRTLKNPLIFVNKL